MEKGDVGSYHAPQLFFQPNHENNSQFSSFTYVHPTNIACVKMILALNEELQNKKS